MLCHVSIEFTVFSRNIFYFRDGFQSKGILPQTGSMHFVESVHIDPTPGDDTQQKQVIVGGLGRSG